MSESSDIIESELRRYYGDRRAKHGFGAGGVGWKSAETQAIIFRQITKVIEERSGFSIADLGCGLGHLYDFLRAEGYADFRYAGYDLLPEMAEAARGLRKESDAVIRHITDAAEMEPADYVVAAGTFNLRYSLPECDRLAHLLRALHAMHERSRVGFAFN